jgi:glycosyltransferase involved in cell wall biosynthesis
MSSAADSLIDLDDQAPGTTRPMKVLYLTHSFPRAPGDAAGSFILRLAVALRQEGIEVLVIAPSGDDLPSHDDFDGIRVERFRYAPRRYENLAYTGNMATQVSESWSARFALLGFLSSEFVSAVRARRGFEPDVVHAHWWFPGGLVGTWLAGLSHVPLITTLHGTDVRMLRTSPVGRTLFRRVVQHSRSVTAVSRWLADETDRMCPGVSPIVAPMPVATELFSPGDGRDPNALLFVGRLSEQKGIDTLLDALAAMRRTPTLDVIGDGPARERLVAKAATLGVSDRVRWHGALPQPQLIDFYRRASAVVMPSTEEGLGMVAIEAMLCRTPVIAFASGGLTDVVLHDQTGLLVPPGNVPALAAAMDAMLDDPARAEQLGEAGRMISLGRFAPESAARRYAALYREASGHRPSATR